jgi:biopolymer transport protein ExbD
MTWKIRREGAPRALEGLTLQQVLDGLRDGVWEPTDEVMGPTDAKWVRIEDHPQLADVAADMESPPVVTHEGSETRLDMNPLIDVALVLLIFFILTTTYETIRKVLDMPAVTVEGPTGRVLVKEIRPELVKNLMITVVARQEGGKPVIKVEDQPVEEKDLERAMKRFVTEKRKTEVLIDAQGVEWGTVVAIQDAAKGAGVNKAHFLVSTPKPQ